MPKYLVVRSWVVEAADAADAAGKSMEVPPQDARAMLVLPSVPAIRVTFATSDLTDVAVPVESKSVLRRKAIQEGEA
jgi:hypothetical protein